MNVDTTDKYFALNYTGSGVAYITEITIVYRVSGSGGTTTCQHASSDWIIDSQATCKVAGSKHIECTKCGEILDAQEIPTTNNHSYSNWSTTSEPKCNQFGSESRTCSICGNVETRQIAKSQHTWNQWVDNGNGTESRECSVCHESENRECANMQKVAEFESAVASVQDATGVEAKWTAIGNALAKYNGLTDSEKDASAEAYALLEGEISEYNATIGAVNEQSNKATSDAINLLAGSISVLAFASYLLLKKA